MSVGSTQLTGLPVDATTPAVRDALTAMVDVVLAAGGNLHPQLRLVERAGNMTVLCLDPAASTQSPGPASPAAEHHEPRLFDVPRALLIPVNDAVWADDREQLRLIDPPPGLTPLQRDVLDLHIALYNAAGKIPWLVQTHPRVALATQPDVVAAIRALRPAFGQRWDPVAETFLSTRTFGLAPIATATSDAPPTERPEHSPRPAPPEASTPTEPPKASVLMTLIDLLNHHPKGAPYQVDERAMTTVVARASGGDECFATYGGRRDVLDLALQYGYVDHHTRFAHCAPVEVDVAGVGRIVVRGHRMRSPNPLDPPRVRRTDDGLEVSHLTFNTGHPERFHIPLKMAVQGRALQLGLTASEAARAADHAADAIVQANLAALAGIEEAAVGDARPATDAGIRSAPAETGGTRPATTTGQHSGEDASVVAGTESRRETHGTAPSPARALMAEAARTQSEIIRTVAAEG